MHPVFKGAKKLHPFFRVQNCCTLFYLRCTCANQVRVQFGNNYSKGAKKGAKSGSNIRVQKILHGKKTYLNLASNPFCKKSFFKWRITIEAEEKKSWNESR